MLRTEKISFNYPSQSGFKGIQKLSLKIERGEFVSILGKSGSGKTTLLKCIFGLEEIEEGKILFNEEEMKGPAHNLVPGHSGMGLV
ncbi:MAG: ABC transporter ATP-binding protein, partial [Bacteroidia bacterium]|nr:ABC transporter ATP-binding protein [Bacteroidia bacterium]